MSATDPPIQDDDGLGLPPDDPQMSDMSGRLESGAPFVLDHARTPAENGLDGDGLGEVDIEMLASMAPRPAKREGEPLRRGEEIDDEEMVIALFRAGGVVSAAAQALHTSRGVIDYRLKSNKVMRRIAQEREQHVLDTATAHLYNGVMKGDRKDVHFVLRERGLDRGYGIQRQEHSAPGGKPLLPGLDAIMGKLTEDELRELHRIRQRLSDAAGPGPEPSDS